MNLILNLPRLLPSASCVTPRVLRAVGVWCGELWALRDPGSGSWGRSRTRPAKSCRPPEGKDAENVVHGVIFFGGARSWAIKK